MTTYALIKLHYNNVTDEIRELIEEMINGQGWEEIYAAEEKDGDFAYLIPADTKTQECQILISDVMKSEIDMPDSYSVTILRSDNTDDWAEYIVLDADADIVRAVVENEPMYYLRDLDAIERTIRESYIGHFDTEEDFAEYLAQDEPAFEGLDEKILNCMDLVQYFSDTINYSTWHSDDGHWFWNN